MKTLITFCLTVLVLSVQAQTSKATRELTDSTGTIYIIEYTYNNSWAMVPAVAGSTQKPHYNAKIIVYRKQKPGRVQVGKPMDGQYVPGGCFEDIPADWVQIALTQK